MVAVIHFSCKLFKCSMQVLLTFRSWFGSYLCHPCTELIQEKRFLNNLHAQNVSFLPWEEVQYSRPRNIKYQYGGLEQPRAKNVGKPKHCLFELLKDKIQKCRQLLQVFLDANCWKFECKQLSGQFQVSLEIASQGIHARKVTEPSSSSS